MRHLTTAAHRIAARYLPDGVKVTVDGVTDADAVAVAYTHRHGHPAWIGYVGSKARPAAHYRARSLDAATDAARAFLAQVAERKAAKAKRDAERKAATAALDARTSHPVGTVVVHTWGWEQTNVDFYKVVGHRGRLGVILAPIPATRVPGSCGLHGMSDQCVADLDAEPGSETVNGRVEVSGRVALAHAARYTFGRSAGTWDGRPVCRSWHA